MARPNTEGLIEMEPFSVIRVAHIKDRNHTASWLVEGLWADRAVGFIAGMPKSGKTWLALELAVAVASGKPCLDRYSVRQRGPVLFHAAEDSAEAIKQRVYAIATVRKITDLDKLAIGLITEHQLRLDDLLPTTSNEACSGTSAEASGTTSELAPR